MPEPIYLCGPTASGKSHLAIALARAVDGEIVNADAFQLYRGLPILTAAPSTEEKSLAPHHLYGVLAPDERCDAMRYRRLALPVIEEILGRGKTPIVTGGSGLYLKFLTHGPSPLPPGDEGLRAELDALPLASLVDELRRLDPVEAARTDLANRRYVTRALEICRLAGRPCSELRDRWESRHREIDTSLRGLVIQRPRAELHARIGLRTAAMLGGGAITEVESLPVPAAGLEAAIGVGPIRDLLAGRLTTDACREAIATATRRYAKRQETWFRREGWLRPLPWQDGSTPPLEAALEAMGDR